MQMKFLLSSRPLLRPSQRFLSTSDKPIRWGILSAGKIASDYAKAIAITEGAQVRTLRASEAHCLRGSYVKLTLALLPSQNRLLLSRHVLLAKRTSLPPSTTLKSHMEAIWIC